MNIILNRQTMRAFRSPPAAYAAGIDLNKAVEVQCEGKDFTGPVLFHAHDATGNGFLGDDPAKVCDWARGRQDVMLDCYTLT